MPGASEQTRQVKVLNVNWTAGADGEDGRFEVMIVTADGEKHLRTQPSLADRVAGIPVVDARNDPGRRIEGPGQRQDRPPHAL